MNENTYKELQAKYETVIKDLRNQIRISEGQKEEALSSQTKLALELQQAKIEREQFSVRLDNRLKDINNNDQSLSEKALFFEKENMNLKKKLAKIQFELTNEKEEQAALIEDLQTELKATKSELMETEKAKKELESELISNNGRGSHAGEISEGIEIMKQNFDKQIKMMKKQLELKESVLKQKQEEIKKMEEELGEAQLEIKKLDFSKNRTSSIFEQVTDDQLKRKNEELELKLLNKEEEYMDKVEAMEKEIDALKLQVINAGSRVSSGKGGGDEMELAALSVENQKLKKALKESQSKGGISSRGMGDDSVLFRENEMLKKNNKELQVEKQKISDELINIKVKGSLRNHGFCKGFFR